MDRMANLTIDGKPYTVKDGLTIIEALDELKIDLPRYCYHPGLSIAGNCRICQVEVEKMPRTVIACNTRVTEGMVISTRSQKAKESQQQVLEFLLINHPLDCPVCDQAGECKLQDYYMDYGLYDPKLNDVKVKKTKKAFSIGPTVMLDQERCILCSCCVRFADEVTKTHDFGIFNRGDHAELDIYPGRELNNKYSGNVVDICPVGALTDKDFRFKMRVWYLGSTESVCPGCARGCNIKIEYEKSRPYHLKTARVMRLKPRENPKVNQWWMCDDGRYGYKSIDENRLLQLRSGPGDSKPLTWTETLSKTAALLKKIPSEKWGVLASPQATNEELYLKKMIFKDYLKFKNIGFKAPGQEGFEDDFLIKKDKNPNTAGAAEILGPAETAGDMTPVIEKAKRGELEGLFVFHHDLAKIFGVDALKTIRQKVKTLIYEGQNDNPTARAADILLPGASYAEKEGTFTNFEGRVQRIQKALLPLGNSRAAWNILLELGVMLGLSFHFTTPEQIFLDLAK
ncbi:MAG: (2Fe-2S)-binding protein, partial [Candidatus Omnitrophica bacterium]|nr:(2Fe-2S)-binding protein [Candidatus Omnitrophota bacterium]